MTDNDLIRARGNRAKALLADELLLEAYEAIERDLINAWINSGARDNDGRERAWHAVQANRKHKAHLQSVLDAGKIAQAELNKIISQPKRSAA